MVSKNDIDIGSWIQDSQSNIYQIQKIEDSYLVLRENSGEIVHSVKYSNCYGVPINEKVLYQNCGFNKLLWYVECDFAPIEHILGLKDYNYLVKYLFSPSSCVHLFFKDGIIGLRVEDDWNDTDIKYVHELQKYFKQESLGRDLEVSF